MSPGSITIPLDDKRRQIGAWWQKLQHVIGGAPLLVAGINRLQAQGGEGRLFALAEIVVSIVLLAMFARDVRAAAAAKMGKTERAEAHEHSGPDWFDVVAGLLLILEAIRSVHPGGKPLYQHALLYTGAVTLLTGLAHGLLTNLSRKRRFIRIDDAGLHVRLSRFRKFDIASPDLIEMQLHEDAAVLVSESGRHLIPLSRYGNASEIRAALKGWHDGHTLPHAI
jgi:hypothetical protein